MAKLSKLEELGLSENGLTGSIPQELGRLRLLRTLDLSWNDLSGGVPSPLGRLEKMESLYLFENHLTAVDDSIFSHYSNAKTISVVDNFFDRNAIDSIVTQIYLARMNYNATRSVLKIGGSNAPPSGTMTNPLVTPGAGQSNSDWEWNGSCHTPKTGQAMIYDLANDVCGNGHKRWQVSS
jgi:Leucine-rich repeat (LRR) protein